MSKKQYLRTEEIKLKNKIVRCNRLNKPIDDILRFWSYMDIKDLFDCWEWQGELDKSGYGEFRFNSKMQTIHRISYQLYHGMIPEGKQVNHTCHNRKCGNPFHVYAGTKQDNSNDMTRASRQVKGESHGMSKLTELQVIEIRENKDKLSQNRLAKIHGVSKGLISLISNNKAWKHILFECY
jgi:hypothetical protein